MGLLSLDAANVSTFLENQIDRPQSNKVLHAHPSPMYWREPQESFASIYGRHRNQDVPVRCNFYVGIPYCLPTDPPHCGFCLFPTTAYEGKTAMRFYLEAVEREAKLVKPFYGNDDVASIYVGGGTPNLMQDDDYDYLMQIVAQLFDGVPEGIEKTIEGIPQLFNEEKIQRIKEAGFNRISMGVQQVSDALIARSGRKQTREQVFRAIALFEKYELNCNVDLIFGWPGQSIEDMLQDLKEICDTQIAHITHYALNIAGRSNFATKARKDVPSTDYMVDMYKASSAYLRSRGYVQRSVYDWELVSASDMQSYQFEHNMRHLFDDYQHENAFVQNMCGIGYAAINMLGSNSDSFLATMNHRNITRYFDDVQRGVIPLERVYEMNSIDLAIAWSFQSLQEMELDMSRYEVLFGRNFVQDFDTIIDALERRGWASLEGERLVIKEDAHFHIPLIQNLMSQSRVKEIGAENAVLRQMDN